MIRIVLIDDDVTTRTNLLDSMWATSDLDILAVGTNGEEAVQLARDHQPDVLLLDLHLSLLHGVEATRQIRAECPNTRILLLTAETDGGRVKAGLAAGAAAAVSHTASPDAILDAVRAAASGKAAPTALPATQEPVVSAQETAPGLRVEVAHVLFLDLVNYSLQGAETQVAWSQLLTGIVHGTEDYRRATAEGELLTLPTGDGMALVFFRDPLAPVRCALAIAKAMPAEGVPALRMGAHSGIVVRHVDAAGRDNVSGEGINLAQRVMSSGDPGHILLSEALAEMLMCFESWKGALTPLGEAEVKHGERLSLFNLVVDGAGNPTRPSRLTPVKS